MKENLQPVQDGPVQKFDSRKYSKKRSECIGHVLRAAAEQPVL